MAAAPNAAPLSLQQRVCDLLRDMLAAKSSTVISGWMLKKGLVLTMFAVFLDGKITVEPEGTGDTPTQAPIQELFMRLVAFMLLLFSSAFLAQRVNQSPRLTAGMKKTYASGLALIPGWAWKDVVSTLISGLTGRRLAANDADKVSPLFNVFLAMLVACLAAAVQIGSEIYVTNAQATGRMASGIVPTGEGSYVFCVFSGLRASLALGVGFAVNNIVKTIFADFWSNWIFQTVYVFVLGVAVPVLQAKGHDAIESRREQLSVFAAKAATFLVTAGNFVMGWAVKGLVDAVFPINCYGCLLPLSTNENSATNQLIKSLIVTVFFVAVLVGCSGLKALHPAVAGVATLTAGMNIGWTWSDYAAALFASRGLDSLDSTVLWAIVGLWAFVVMIVGVVVFAAGMLEYFIRMNEPPPPPPAPIQGVDPEALTAALREPGATEMADTESFPAQQAESSGTPAGGDGGATFTSQRSHKQSIDLCVDQDTPEAFQAEHSGEETGDGDAAATSRRSHAATMQSMDLCVDVDVPEAFPAEHKS